jgi:excisionase family DNA binding protein
VSAELAAPLEELLTPDEVAAALRVPTSWVYNRISSRTLPFAHFKLGKYVRIRKRDLEVFLAGAGKGGRAS